MNISQLIFGSIFIGFSGYSSSHLDNPLYVVEPSVLQHMEGALGRQISPENGIARLRKCSLEGKFAEYDRLREGLAYPGKQVSDRTVKWVHTLISTPNANQKCFRRLIPVDRHQKILRYQYKIAECIELKEVTQWDNNTFFYKDYAHNTGFLILEFVYESDTQKCIRISADWAGLSESISTVHRAPDCLKRKHIRRERPH